MSLLQEMETHGLADCEFNRKLLKEKIYLTPKQIEFLNYCLMQFVEDCDSSSALKLDRIMNKIIAMNDVIKSYA